MNDKKMEIKMAGSDGIEKMLDRISRSFGHVPQGARLRLRDELLKVILPILEAEFLGKSEGAASMRKVRITLSAVIDYSADEDEHILQDMLTRQGWLANSPVGDNYDILQRAIQDLQEEADIITLKVDLI